MSFDINKKKGGGVTCADIQRSNPLSSVDATEMWEVGNKWNKTVPFLDDLTSQVNAPADCGYVARGS